MESVSGIVHGFFALVMQNRAKISKAVMMRAVDLAVLVVIGYYTLIRDPIQETSLAANRAAEAARQAAEQAGQTSNAVAALQRDFNDYRVDHAEKHEELWRQLPRHHRDGK